MLNVFVLKAGIKIFESHRSAREIQENYKNKCELLSFFKKGPLKHGSYCLSAPQKAMRKMSKTSKTWPQAYHRFQYPSG